MPKDTDPLRYNFFLAYHEETLPSLEVSCCEVLEVLFFFLPIIQRSLSHIW